MSGKYDDIIDLPHPTSKKHPRMSRQNRAAQFSPFAALTGIMMRQFKKQNGTQRKKEYLVRTPLQKSMRIYSLYKRRKMNILMCILPTLKKI